MKRLIAGDLNPDWIRIGSDGSNLSQRSTVSFTFSDENESVRSSIGWMRRSLDELTLKTTSPRLMSSLVRSALEVWLSLELRSHLCDIREWKLKIEGHPKDWNPPLALQEEQSVKCCLYRILLEAGIALTPAEDIGDVRSWFPLFKYASDFSFGNPQLVLESFARKWDPRLKAVVSEEVAVGVACYLLREYFNVRHISDLYEVVGTEVYFANPTKSRRPDFYCVTTNDEIIIAEAKGTTGTERLLDKALAKGLSQVGNVALSRGTIAQKIGRTVIGTAIGVLKHDLDKSSSLTKIAFGSSHAPGSEKKHKPSSGGAVAKSYAKVARYAGNRLLADRFGGGIERRYASRSLYSYEALAAVAPRNFKPLGVDPLGVPIFLPTTLFNALLVREADLAAAARQALDAVIYPRELDWGIPIYLANGVLAVVPFGDRSIDKLLSH